MKIIIPFTALKKMYDTPETTEVMGIIHSNDGVRYDRVLFSHYQENKNSGNECKIDDIVIGTVSFHTHPKVCYVKYKTDKGWPSLDDMSSFINEDKMRILLVPSMEGTYIVVKKKRPGSSEMSTIKKQYKSNIKKDKMSIEEYVDTINNSCKDCIKILFFSKDKIFNESQYSTINIDTY